VTRPSVGIKSRMKRLLVSSTSLNLWVNSKSISFFRDRSPLCWQHPPAIVRNRRRPSRRSKARFGHTACWSSVGTEGQTLVECVSTAGRVDQLPTLAPELVARRPDVLATSPAPCIKALREETTTIPIVMLSTPDAVDLGLITTSRIRKATSREWLGSASISSRNRLSS
jgi:hypothetical protein